MQKKCTEDANMRRFPLQRAQRLLFVGPIAVLLLISVKPARTQTNNYDFNATNDYS